MSVLHLLKKHNKSRRPSSWREKNITKSKEEAIEELKELRELANQVDSDDAEVFRDFFFLSVCIFVLSAYIISF